MSILTKIFVVLVTVLSVGLVAMIVPFVYKTEQYKLKYESEVARRWQAEDSASMNQQLIQTLGNSNSQQVGLLTNESNKLKTELGKLATERANLEAQLTTERSNQTAMQSQIARLSATLAQATDITKVQMAEIASMRDANAKYKTDYFQAIEQLKTLESQNDTLDKTVKRNSEELTRLEEANIKLQNLLAQVPEQYRNPTANNAPAMEAPFRIEGQVTQIRKIDNNVFAEVNVGKKDGVSENMKFYVHRNAVYLGTLVITKADQKNAAGRMVSMTQDIQNGDIVVSGQ